MVYTGTVSTVCVCVCGGIVAFSICNNSSLPLTLQSLFCTLSLSHTQRHTFIRCFTSIYIIHLDRHTQTLTFVTRKNRSSLTNANFHKNMKHICNTQIATSICSLFNQNAYQTNDNYKINRDNISAKHRKKSRHIAGK